MGTARVVERADGRVRLAAGAALAEVTALAPDCFRVGLFGDGRPVEYPAHAVAPRAPAQGEVEESAGRARLATAEARATIALDPLRISFQAGGATLAADDPALGMGFERPASEGWLSLGPAPRLHKLRGAGERFFGCGERTSGLEKTGSHQVFWNVDPPAGHTASFNNLYTASSSTTRAARRSTSPRPTRGASPGRSRAATSSTTCSAGRRRRASSSASPSSPAARRCRRCGRSATSSRAGAT